MMDKTCIMTAGDHKRDTKINHWDITEATGILGLKLSLFCCSLLLQLIVSLEELIHKNEQTKKCRNNKNNIFLGCAGC